mmetsp:Transcript_17600/g.49874  ORF Transcript_17600/g.49874 Transcript_17600/m.49874 type:complete len:249 (+) Transcript_17600:264-1010(+)
MWQPRGYRPYRSRAACRPSGRPRAGMSLVLAGGADWALLSHRCPPFPGRAARRSNPLDHAAGHSEVEMHVVESHLHGERLHNGLLDVHPQQGLPRARQRVAVVEEPPHEGEVADVLRLRRGDQMDFRHGLRGDLPGPVERHVCELYGDAAGRSGVRLDGVQLRDHAFEAEVPGRLARVIDPDDDVYEHVDLGGHEELVVPELELLEGRPCYVDGRLLEARVQDGSNDAEDCKGQNATTAASHQNLTAA